MLEAGWVGRIKPDSLTRGPFGRRGPEGQERWTLLANPRQLRLADVYRMFAFGVGDGHALGLQVEQAIEEGLGQSLAEYFEGALAKAPSPAVRDSRQQAEIRSAGGEQGSPNSLLRPQPSPARGEGAVLHGGFGARTLGESALKEKELSPLVEEGRVKEKEPSPPGGEGRVRGLPQEGKK